MARDFMAQMLDELMGRNRNARPDERKELRWDDESVCKHFLACYCPNELFTNTKADLGICKLLHDDDLKAQYQADPRKGKMGYEDGFLRFLKGMIQDVDRRIERGKGRLDAARQVTASNTGTKYDDKVREFTQRIEDLVQEAEKLGGQGKVEEAQAKLRQSDQLRKERDGLKATLELAVQQEKQLEVCQTCGAFLIVGDAQQRIDDHLSGKQHGGYAKIRETVEEEEAKMQKEAEDRRKERELDRGGNRGGRESEKLDRNGRTRSRSRERSKPSEDRHNRRHSRSRSKDRSKRHRSRSGSKKKERDRSSRERHKSSKHRSRSRSRDRSRRSSKSDKRDKSRDREEKSRSSKSRDGKKHRSRSPDSKRRERRRSRSSEISRGSSKTAAEATNNHAESQNEQVPSLGAIELPKGDATPQRPEADISMDE